MYLSARRLGVYIECEHVFKQARNLDMTNVKENTVSFIMDEQEVKQARSRAIRKQ